MAVMPRCAAIACALVAGCFASASVAQETWAEAAAPASIVVTANAVTYRIPIEYTPGVVTPDHHSYSSATIGLLLPDFRPAASDPSEFRRLGWYNQLVALIKPDRHDIDPMQFVRALLSYGHLSEADFTIEHDVESIEET